MKSKGNFPLNLLMQNKVLGGGFWGGFFVGFFLKIYITERSVLRRAKSEQDSPLFPFPEVLQQS